MKYQMLISGMLIDITKEQAYILGAHNPKYKMVHEHGYVIPIWQKPSSPKYPIDFRYVILDGYLVDLDDNNKIICSFVGDIY